MINDIRELVEIKGVSGNEGSVAAYIKNNILPYVDKVYEDALGNLVAVRKGEGPKVMLMAHMDEIGLVATFVDEKGFVRVSSVGYVNPMTTIGRPVVFDCWFSRASRISRLSRVSSLINYPTIAKMSLWRMMRYLVPSSSSSVPAYLP